MKKHPILLKQILLYMVLAMGISWLLWFPLYGEALGVQVPHFLPKYHFLGAFGPITAAFVVRYLFAGSRGVTQLWQRMWQVPHLQKSDIKTVLAILGAPFFFLLLAVGVDAGIQGSLQPFLELLAVVFSFGFVSKLFFDLVTFGFGEEVGWRGVITPLLQSRYSVVTAAVLTTAVWSLWHAPMFLYRDGYVQMVGPMMIGWLLSLFTGSVILSYLLNKSKGSLLVVAFFHSIIDFAFTYDRSSQLGATLIGALVTFLGIGLLVRIVKAKQVGFTFPLLKKL